MTVVSSTIRRRAAPRTAPRQAGYKPGQEIALAIDDDNSTSEAAPDVIVAICNNAEVDIDKLSTDITGESIINRAGYEGLGKGLATNWTAPYRVIVTGRAGSGSESQTSAKIKAIR